MKQRFFRATLVAFCAVVFSAIALSGATWSQAAPAAATAPAVSAPKPLIVWYSRTGTSELVAETLEQQLGCDRERIPSTKDRGIFSIVYEQFFGGADEQGKFPRDLAPYNPVIIAAPIYFMKLSAPGRAFMELNRDALRGKDIVIFVTLGGKLSEDKKQAIKDFGSGLGLTVRQVAFLQTGRKDEFPRRISELVKQGPLRMQAKQ